MCRDGKKVENYCKANKYIYTYVPRYRLRCLPPDNVHIDRNIDGLTIMLIDRNINGLKIMYEIGIYVDAWLQDNVHR